MEFLVELAQVPIGSYATWGAVILVAVSGLIQIAPIKVNPWSSLARAIGRAINKDIIDRVSSVEKDIKEFRDQEDEREAKSHRMRILRFGDEIRHQQLHSAEHYNDVLQDISDYESYCKKHPEFKNQKAKATIKLITDAYAEHMMKNDFLN